MKRTPTAKLCEFIDEWLDRHIASKTRQTVLEQACDEIQRRSEDGDRTAARFIKAWIRGAVP